MQQSEEVLPQELQEATIYHKSLSKLQALLLSYITDPSVQEV